MAQRLEFTKLHGAGNDFVFVEDMADRVVLSPEQVAALCDRHFGIGADGVVLVKPACSESNHGFMDYRNADGTLAQMCGNGIRCFAKYLVDHGLVDEHTPLLNVETRAGVKTISYTTDSRGKMTTATVDMGSPMLNPHEVPTSIAFNAMADSGEVFVRDAPIDSPFGTMNFTCISMGNPHAVTFVDDVYSVDVDKLGSYYESCDAFPEKTNVEFASVREDAIHMRVFERGCGETLACGTGACATNVAAFLTGRAGSENDIVLRGGTLRISYTPGGSVLMTGSAKESFTGVIEI